MVADAADAMAFRLMRYLIRFMKLALLIGTEKVLRVQANKRRLVIYLSYVARAYDELSWRCRVLIFGADAPLCMQRRRAR